MENQVMILIMQAIMTKMHQNLHFRVAATEDNMMFVWQLHR